MKPAQALGPDYAARIRRAQDLATAKPFAAEVLRFYAALAVFQKNLYAQVAKNLRNQPLASGDGELRSKMDRAILLPHFPGFLAIVERTGPPPIAETAQELSHQSSAAWAALLGDFWTGAGLRDEAQREAIQESGEPLTELILRAFLQPYAEFRVAHMATPQLAATYRVCPCCGSVPLLGVLRPEGDGGKRCLVCSFCLYEWDFRRILCPACGEEAEKKLPVYVAEQFPHIRVECCESCRSYLRTVDLTKDGHAVPLVDDLAAIPLTLWAHEHGYTRLQANLLGT